MSRQSARGKALAGVADPDALADAADELYGVGPEGFVAQRDAAAREARDAGDRTLAAAIGGLPKPTVAAFLLNQLARRRPDAVEQLVVLGAELRAAQQSLAGDQLRALTRQRQAVVAGFVQQVHALAAELGRSISDQVTQQVEQTLRAAVADAGAAEALRSARLTTGLSYVGLGDVDVSAAVAAPRAVRDTPAVSKTRDGPEQPPTAPHARLDELRRQLAEAAAAQDEAAEQLETADGRVRAYEAERAERRDWVARLRDELSSAQAAAEESAAQLRQAERERADARRVAAQAAETVERARKARRSGAVTRARR